MDDRDYDFDPVATPFEAPATDFGTSNALRLAAAFNFALANEQIIPPVVTHRGFGRFQFIDAGNNARASVSANAGALRGIFCGTAGISVFWTG